MGHNECALSPAVRYKAHQDVFSGLWYAEALDSRLPNVYGQGLSEAEAVTSLRIRINQLKE